jgi:serine/threonine protein kinase
MSFRPEHPSLPEGTVVAGKLRIVRELGIGGMGTVYEVEHELTRHRRALKILHARAAQEPSAVTRFLREASAAARIGNAHIAETFDAGRLDTGEPYLVMELLEGETLDQRLQRVGAIGPAELAELVSQACDGVQAAHDAGIVHRDLKPENLFVTVRDGRPFVKVLDFGISKFDSARTGGLAVTTEGVLIGTPYYMPPEQVRGEKTIDAKADVYALGVILYECAAGARPYEARTVEHLAVLIHEGKPIPLAERNPSLPSSFCGTVHRAMAVERDQRFQSARELADALAPMVSLASLPSAAPTAGKGPSVAAHAGHTIPPNGRVVIRPSSAPRALDFVTTASPISSSVTATGLAETMSSDPAPPPGRRRPSSRSLVVAMVVAMAAGGGILAVTMSARPGASAASPNTGATPTPLLSVTAAPAPPVESVFVAPSASSSAGAASSAGPVRPANPGARPALPIASPAPGPAAIPPKSRVDQSGLAGENPFR